ncbi:MAG: beta-lactamase class C [Candidatus Azotimanducaceae bacterium]|jgi:beta-lactamase class C
MACEDHEESCNLRPMKSRSLPLLLSLSFSCLSLSFCAQSSFAEMRSDDFVSKLEREYLRPIVEKAPGAAIVVVVDGQVVLEKTWGVRKEGYPELVTPATLFRIASISKTFASAAASILVEETPLSWQTPVLESVGHLKFKRSDYGKLINLNHLMSQTSGLMPHAYTNLVEDNMSYERILKRLHKVDFVCPPGKCYGYQNVVFSLIGDVVKANTGMDYQSFVKNKLFTPLSMTRASFGRENFLQDNNHAEPHVWNGNRWKPARTTHHYYRIPPAAGVNASIDDMRAWLMAQLGHKPEVLSEKMLNQMQTGVIKTTRQQAHYRWHRGIENVHYGLGWRTFDYAGQTGFVQHGGYVKGMRSEMVFNRQLQTGMVFLTNSEPRELGNLVFDFLDLYQKNEAQNGLAQSVVLGE